jgi:hypothetical protein
MPVSWWDKAIERVTEWIAVILCALIEVVEMGNRRLRHVLVS